MCNYLLVFALDTTWLVSQGEKTVKFSSANFSISHRKIPPEKPLNWSVANQGLLLCNPDAILIYDVRDFERFLMDD